MRYAEFAQACVEKSLEANQAGPKVVYYGLFRETAVHKKMLADIQFKVFKHWDEHPDAPPKNRARAQVSRMVDNLQLLACSDAGPAWPTSLNNKFRADTPEFHELAGLKEAFHKLYPPSAAPAPSPGAGTPPPPRIVGQPDYSIDQEPLDVSRVIEPHTEAPPPPGDRTDCQTEHVFLVEEVYRCGKDGPSICHHRARYVCVDRQ